MHARDLITRVQGVDCKRKRPMFLYCHVTLSPLPPPPTLNYVLLHCRVEVSFKAAQSQVSIYSFQLLISKHRDGVNVGFTSSLIP